MSRKARPWIRHPPKTITHTPAPCPRGVRYITKEGARLALQQYGVSTTYLRPTPCTLCDGWHNQPIIRDHQHNPPSESTS